MMLEYPKDIDHIDFSFAIQKIVLHPDLVLPDVGNELRGVIIQRDTDVPKDEIRLIGGTRMMVLKLKKDTP